MSILTGLIELCHKNTGLTITICRKTFPALRATAMRDFFDILTRENAYHVENHNKSEATYLLWDNLVEFISIDQPQKIRGRKRDVLFINEANELSLEDWRQLILRTTERIIIDYNPSDEFSWIYDEVIPREDATFFQTTYKDNPFLDASIIAEIERLKEADENFWRVYGLGERGSNKATIFNHYQVIKTIPDGFKPLNYGLDFGFTNHPSAGVQIFSDGHGFLIKEIFYQQRMSNRDIATAFELGEVHQSPVIGDNAEPKSIQEIHGYGINIHPCKKGRDSIRAGIQFMQSRPLYILEESINVIKEFRNYKWREDKNGHLLNEPVDAYNHAIDAARYAITYNQANPNFGHYTMG